MLKHAVGDVKRIACEAYLKYYKWRKFEIAEVVFNYYIIRLFGHSVSP